MLLPCERRVAALVAQGKPNKIIAWELKLTPGTVKNYIHEIFRKLHVSNRVELTLWVISEGRT